jgi:hypothetical protein
VFAGILAACGGEVAAAGRIVCEFDHGTDLRSNKSPAALWPRQKKISWIRRMIKIHAMAFATRMWFLSRRPDVSCCGSKRQSARSAIIGASLENDSKTSGSLATVCSTLRSLAVIGELAARQWLLLR